MPGIDIEKLKRGPAEWAQYRDGCGFVAVAPGGWLALWSARSTRSECVRELCDVLHDAQRDDAKRRKAWAELRAKGWRVHRAIVRLA